MRITKKHIDVNNSFNHLFCNCGHFVLNILSDLINCLNTLCLAVISCHLGAMMEGSVSPIFTGTTLFSPVTSRNSIAYLKKVAGGFYTCHVYYICARKKYRRQKSRYKFFLAYLIKFLIWTMLPSASVTRMY